MPEGYSQNTADPGIALFMSPPSVPQASTGTLSALVGNFGNDSIVENSLRVTISVSDNAEITGIAPGSDSHWSLLELTTGPANTIKLTNSNEGFGPFDVGDIVLNISGLVLSDPEVILGNIVYIAVPNPLLCGGCAFPPLNSSQGNGSSSNDNSTTSLAVTCSESPEPPVVNCWDDFVFNTTTCVWDNIGTQDAEPPVVNCWDDFVFNNTTCVWDNIGTQDDEPPLVNCWDVFVFNNTTCAWDTTGTQDDEPIMVNCWDVFVFNNTTCAWDTTGTQDDEPTMVNCWDVFVFNNTTCAWDTTGTQDDEPTMVNCWDVFVFNNTTCAWDTTGTQDDEPTMVNCWDVFVFNNTTCAWDTTGTQDAEPTMVNCWDVFVFNNTTCVWDNIGTQDDEPAMVNCWDVFVFNNTTCAWDNTGTQDDEPAMVNCWDVFVFNNTTCAWDNIGIPQEPNAGTDGTLTVCEGPAPTDAELFAQLGGAPDAGGMWSAPVDGVYTYTVSGTGSCASETDTSTVTIEDCPECSQPVLVGDYPADVYHVCAESCPPVPTLEFTDPLDDDLVIIYTETTEELECGEVVTRTWTATNFCGNSVTVIQVLTSYDDVAPVVEYATPDMTISCSDEIPEIEVIFVDNCDSELTLTVNTQIEGSGCNIQITKTCVATDDCGNSISSTTVITIVDTTPPLLIGVPSDITLECGEEVSDAIVFATDNCDEDLVIALTAVSNPIACGYELIRTWTTVDDCGNEASESQTIIFGDSVDPILVGVPADVTVECDAVPEAANVSVTDNCDVDPDIDFSELITPGEPAMEGGHPCGWTVERTWIATDLCGNTSEGTQTITVVDTTAPDLIGVPANITVQCDGIPEAPIVTAVDNCDEFPMEVVLEENILQLDCGYQLIRTWIVEDNCWNYNSASQVITVVDTTDPVLSGVPNNITVECDAIPVPAVVTASDNCTSEFLDVNLTENTFPLGCGYALIRYWTVHDACGNTVTESQVITVVDLEAPVWDTYDDYITLQCDLVEGFMLTASDNCDANVEVTIIEELTFSGGCFGTLERTYEAKDDCGNSITATQLIQITDNILPELFNIPADEEIACGDDVPAIPADVFATDNCDDDVEIQFTEVQTNEFCPYQIIRTWTAIDNCFNATELQQIITVTVDVPTVVSLFSYPNPFDDQFTVEFTVPVGAEVLACIYDIVGREVQLVHKGKADAERLYSYNFNGSIWESGTYVIMMMVDDEVYYHKIMVMD
jgi:hypothetical protein